jgi:chromosome partitioning protein
MSRIIAVANQKGGVGKTTSAINLSAALAEEGKRVLALDIDPQGNMTSGFGLNKNELDKTVYDLLCGNAEIEECIQREVLENLDILPGNINLSAIEIELIDVENREYIMKEEVEKIKDNYDFIIIDCPPALSMLTINALTTASSVLVPIQSEYYALEGLTQLIHTIELVKDRLNEELEIEGIVFTMYDTRTNLSHQVVENVKDNIKYKVYDTIIPRNIRLAEAPSHGLPISIYDPKSTGAIRYKELAREVIKEENL